VGGTGVGGTDVAVGTVTVTVAVGTVAVTVAVAVGGVAVTVAVGGVAVTVAPGGVVLVAVAGTGVVTVGAPVIPPEGGVSVQFAATSSGEPIITGNCAAAYPGSLLAIAVVFPTLSITTRFCTV
jgi:hypothetical protein